MTHTATSKREEFLDFWQNRERWFLTAAPYTLLWLCVAVDMVSRTGGLDRGAVLDAGCAVLASLVMAVLDRYDRRERWYDTSPVLLRFAGPAFLAIVLLSGVLVVQNSLYGFYTWTGYLWSFRLLPGRLRFVGVATAAVPVAISQTGSGTYASAGAIIALAAVWVVNSGLASLFSWFGAVGNEQEQRRTDRVTALTEANARLAESLAENAKLNQQLVAHAREAGVADERRRMAREIHDTLAQGLMGIITQLQAAQTGGGAGDPGAEKRITAAIELARQGLTEARRSVAALAPEPLDGTRLSDAVGGVAQRWSELHGIPIAVTTTGEVRAIRPEAEVALLRTAQEALTNVAKHAHARRVGLTLSYMPDVITLDIRDDGVGFNAVDGMCPDRPRGEHGGGFGLSVMRERIESVSGSFAVESEPEVGTAISAAVPVPPGGPPMALSGRAA